MYLSGAGGGIINRVDGPEDRSLAERCLGGALPDFGSFVGGFSRIVQAPAKISIFYDGGQDGLASSRFDGPAPAETIRQWGGGTHAAAGRATRWSLTSTFLAEIRFPGRAREPASR